MIRERWKEIKDKLDAALDLEPAQRRAYLNEVAGANPELGRELESLLAAHEKAGTDFLNAPAAKAIAQSDVREPSEILAGKRIGAYRIVAEIGVGGMGEVYRAFRVDEYKKEVAIKVVRAGQDSGFVVSRFKNERQILASLDHPNIARLLDGGTTESGLPYFVMELIEGQPIDEYCHNRKVSTAERLRLFLQVCSAVQFAHQRLIIHRDIKPSNILVTSNGTPKLLDFGIAKILDTEAVTGLFEPTLTIFRALTPAYASPEQVKGEPITTASDVYSLGVVLYELLTGCHPYRKFHSTPQEIGRAACEVEPEKPSIAVKRKIAEARGEILSPAALPDIVDSSVEKLSKRLRGDLDNIVLMALRKEPQRRYASVEQFAEDLRRYLENLPVLARNDTIGYRTSKFISRHWAGVAAAILVVLTVTAGLIATYTESRIAERERARAEQRFNDVRELAKWNLFDLHDAIQPLPGSAPVRHLVIQRALTYLDKLSRDAGGDRGLMREVASGYERIAGLEGNFSGPGIGDSKAALESYQKALAIREFLVASSNNDVNELKAKTRLLGSYARLLLIMGRTEEALRIAKNGLNLAELVVQKRPQDPDAIIGEARTHLYIAAVMGGDGSSASTRQLPEAIEHDRAAVRLLEQLAGAKQDAILQKGLFQARVALAFHLGKNREFDQALHAYDASISSGFESLPASARFSFYNHRAVVFDRIGDFRRALDDERKNFSIVEPMVQADPSDLVAQINLAITQGSTGVQEARLGEKVAGEKLVDAAIESGERLLAANRYERFYQSLLLIGYSYQGEILSRMGDQNAAFEKYSQSLATASELAQNEPQDLESRLGIAKLHTALAVVLAKRGRYSEAQDELRTSLKNSDDLLNMRPQDAEILYVDKMARDYLAALNQCSPGRVCGSVSSFQLPNLNN